MWRTHDNHASRCQQPDPRLLARLGGISSMCRQSWGFLLPEDYGSVERGRMVPWCWAAGWRTKRLVSSVNSFRESNPLGLIRFLINAKAWRGGAPNPNVRIGGPLGESCRASSCLRFNSTQRRGVHRVTDTSFLARRGVRKSPRK
jgi:hypothetical protein